MSVVLPKKVKNLAGRTYGRLFVTGFIGLSNHKALWKCRCSCGVEIDARSTDITRGHTESCGCSRVDKITTHGKSKCPEYKVWDAMIGRCTRPKDKGYANYGGRGIAVCERWLHSFQSFLADMGPRPSSAHSIDRINNDDGYHPGNCRWVTREQQNRNTRRNRVVEYRGEKCSIAELATRFRIPYGTFRSRLRLGWSVEKIVTTGARKKAFAA